MSVNAFIGSWSLVSSMFKGEDGKVNHPLGEQVLGRINYEPNGTMAAQLYSATRPRLPPTIWRRAPGRKPTPPLSI